MAHIDNRKRCVCHILILLLLAIPVQGTPVPPCRTIGQILADPCGGCNVVAAADAGCQPRIDCGDALSIIATETQMARDLCQTLVTRYNSGSQIRISDKYRAFLAGANLHEYQFPNAQNRTLTQYYEDISVIAIFVDVSYQQEVSEDYRNDMMDVRNKLKQLLCSIHNQTCSISASILASMNLTEYPFTVTKTSERHRRDFISFRDAAAYLNNTHYVC